MKIQLKKTACTYLLLLLATTGALAQNYYGTWRGNATQPGGATQNWSVVMTLNKNNYSIDFPSLGCGGTLSYIRKDGNAYIFSEGLTYGTTKCLLGVSVRFTLTGTTTMSWEEIDASGTALAYGTLTRDPLPDVNITITRKQKLATCTQGTLSINGAVFCQTLELLFDNAKKDSSSIPTGVYNAKLKYSTAKNRWVIELQNIYPHVYYKDGNTWKMKTVTREFVQIHAGDYPIKPAQNLQGCILPGNTSTGCGFTDSKTTFRDLLETYFGSASDPDKTVKITVTVQLGY
jgi:Family of unknown function (DUF5675)